MQLSERYGPLDISVRITGQTRGRINLLPLPAEGAHQIQTSTSP